MPATANPRLGGRTNQPYILAQSAVPVILAPNGTIATNGIVTLGTALPTTYSGGAWVRFPAGAVSGGSAGLYWTVFSSTTAGQVTTTFVDPATQFIPYIPTGLTNAVGSNVAYTQTTAADITLANITVPGGAMGANGALRGWVLFGHTNSAGNKTYNVKVGSTSIYAKTRTTSVGESFNGGIIRNRGASNRNMNLIGTTQADSGGALAALPALYSIDTSVDQVLTYLGNLATATDFIVLEGFSIEVLPS